METARRDFVVLALEPAVPTFFGLAFCEPARGVAVFLATVFLAGAFLIAALRGAAFFGAALLGAAWALRGVVFFGAALFEVVLRAAAFFAGVALADTLVAVDLRVAAFLAAFGLAAVLRGWLLLGLVFLFVLPVFAADFLVVAFFLVNVLYNLPNSPAGSSSRFVYWHLHTIGT